MRERSVERIFAALRPECRWFFLVDTRYTGTSFEQVLHFGQKGGRYWFKPGGIGRVQQGIEIAEQGKTGQFFAAGGKDIPHDPNGITANNPFKGGGNRRDSSNTVMSRSERCRRNWDRFSSRGFGRLRMVSRSLSMAIICRSLLSLLCLFMTFTIDILALTSSGQGRRVNAVLSHSPATAEQADDD